MKKFIIASLLIGASALVAPAQTEFRHVSFEEALAAAKKENKFNASVFNDRNKLNKEVNADMKKLAAASAKIDRKYGSRGKGYNSTAVESIKRARLGKQVQYIERKVKRLTNAGGAYQNTLNRFNRMTNSNYENKTNTNGGGKI